MLMEAHACGTWEGTMSLPIQGISSALFGPASDPSAKPTAAAQQAQLEIAQTNHEAAAASAVPAHSTVTIYNAKGQSNQVGAVPSAPHK